MTQDEQIQLDQLRAQLDSIRASTDQTRDYFSRAMGKLTNEVRFYRGIFWCCLALTTAAIIVSLLRR